MTIFLRDQPETGASCLVYALHRVGALDRLAEGGTAALAAWWLTDRQGRLDYITTSVLSLWHLTAARAGRMEQSPRTERLHCSLGREHPMNHVGEQWTACPAEFVNLLKLVSCTEWHFGPLANLTDLGGTHSAIRRPLFRLQTPRLHHLTAQGHKPTPPKTTAARQSYHQRGQVTSTPKPPSRRRASHRALSDSCQMDGTPPLGMLHDSRHHMRQDRARDVQITMIAKLLRELAVHPKQLQVELRGCELWEELRELELSC